MASSRLEVQKIILSDKLTALINTPHVRFDEINAALDEELRTVSGGRALDQLTDFIHLVSFIKAKHFSNPIRALQLFADKETPPETRKALIKAIGMAPERDDRIYDIVCLLAQNDKLVRYFDMTHLTPLRFAMREREDSYVEEHSAWYLAFDLFGLCKKLPHELIPLVAKLLSATYPSTEDLQALELFFNYLDKFKLLQNEIIAAMLPQLKNKKSIENLQSLLIYLQQNDLLKPQILEYTLPLLHQLDALKIFFSVYSEELRSAKSCQETLEKLPPYCQLSLLEESSFDDVVTTNTPLHLAVIQRNLFSLNQALHLANAKFLLATSYDNTALVLACKLADKQSAQLILSRMRELGCDVNQADHHGMTALHWARFYHFDDLATELIAAGAKEELKATNGKNSIYFSKHQFILADFKIEGGSEIIEDNFKLHNCALTDIAFHAEKIALNLKLTNSDEVMDLYQSDERAQIRTSNRFYLFFKTFRPRLVDWLEKQREMDYQVSHQATPS
ncbi:ankyrin repeat-containing protein [Legionella steigerwaltii]|uniref:Ankyrin repeat-containing protein n=1 Tax=Legionella steigerwaltii TaxID=460 RepID=A0A378LB52_9GAMM|nr:Dot/Icm T4SS effector AnkQ/LegA10 [Legionella steigerwaltii]KTD71914.1 ankyrin repeat-containing protein [Legionella steigerwaltii]STY23937.1 ankyrin repeat-containing protein [Legionella steigerwaltii]